MCIAPAATAHRSTPAPRSHHCLRKQPYRHRGYNRYTTSSTAPAHRPSEYTYIGYARCPMLTHQHESSHAHHHMPITNVHHEIANDANRTTISPSHLHHSLPSLLLIIT